jgi:hypothetical protein
MDEKNPFAGNMYIHGSSPTTVTSPVASEEDSIKAKFSLNGALKESFSVEQSRYGSGKPYRVVIRGKIST